MKDNKSIVSTNVSSYIELEEFLLYTKDTPLLSDLHRALHSYRGMSNEEFKQWFVGFTDAEGCFNVSITSNLRYSLGQVIKMRYLLDQKDRDILLTIQNLFGFGKVTIRPKTNGVYRYTVTGFKSINGVIIYFKEFPLLTKKGRSFNKWLEIHDIVSDKLHLSEKGLIKVRALQKQINTENSLTKKTGSAHP